MRAIIVDKPENQYQASVQLVEESQLPDGDVSVDVEWSTINYKDALAISGKAPVVRSFPMVPGIDFVGKVRESGDSRYKAGDYVVLNGWGVGEGHWGGYAQIARVKGDWLIPLPDGITPRYAMAIGTAGYTAMLCVMALEKHGIQPDDGEILITGATGGVGSVAIALLSKLGYSVTAVSGKSDAAEYLHQLGAKQILPRDEFSAPGKPLAKERWAGVIDVAGGNTLANACAQTKYGGAVAACGLAESMQLPATVAPFILRGVHLIGVDSVMCPREKRLAAWQRLATDLDMQLLDKMLTEIPLDEVIPNANALLVSKLKGRVVVKIAD
ncbi:MDR family oxidoreductase [Pseudobowmanella zhangzhouensis]|uniref:acrylyl-CoA reductase (NADPH) n=1 Tax=Pseudobowmanella zhangzhouensis TaxID=1537679 RepID=UPI00360E8D0E